MTFNQEEFDRSERRRVEVLELLVEAGKIPRNPNYYEAWTLWRDKADYDGAAALLKAAGQ